MKKIKSYLMELVIVTVGVLIALFLSNVKESSQARKYCKESIETINNEVVANYSDLKGVIENQKNLRDTLYVYNDAPISIIELLEKVGDLKAAELSNVGLEFYKRNQIHSIDFKIMSMLNEMNILSEGIDDKINRLADFVYSNILEKSKENKMVLILHLQNTLDTEEQLLTLYREYIDENMDEK